MRPDNSGTDRITIDDQFRSSIYDISHFIFDDVTWTAADLQAQLAP